MTIFYNTARILTNITKLSIIGLQICVVRCNGDRWSLLKKFRQWNINTSLNINTPPTPIKKVQEHTPTTEEEFLGDNFPHISKYSI